MIDAELLERVKVIVAGDGEDPAFIIACALERLAEEWADDERGLCSRCGRRRVARGHTFCTWCDQQFEAQLEHKRRWWDNHGNEQRLARRAQERAAASG